MPAKIYIVELTKAERKELQGIIHTGKQTAQKRKRAQALVLSADGYTDEIIAERVGMHLRSVEQLRQRFVEEGFEKTLEGKPRGHRPRAIRGEDEARLLALVCGPKPEGRTRWTLRLLQKKWSTLAGTEVKSISYETIRRTLKKTKLSLGESRNGVSRRKQTVTS
jgi:transposase